MNSVRCVSHLTKQAEKGRSLVEMMGTLAIMGMLALAGVWMYNSAMDRLKANIIINGAQKRAVVVAGQIGFQGRTDPSLGEFQNNEFAGGTFSTEVVTNGLYEQFGILVLGVPKRICENILASIGAVTPIRRLSQEGTPATAITTCFENNSFLLIYNNDMSTGGHDTGYCDNSACQTVCGQCVIENGESHCVNECPTNTGTCSVDADCSGECVACVKEGSATTGTCQSCQPVEYLEATGAQYINTGITFKNTDESYATVALINLGTDKYFISASPWNASCRYALGGTYANNRYCLGYGILSTGSTPYQPSTVANKLPHQYSYKDKMFRIEDLNLSRDVSSVGFNCEETAELRLFYGYNAPTACKIYSYRQKRGNEWICDFVPVLDPRGVPALWDRKRKQLFYDASGSTTKFKTNLDG